MKSFIAKIVYSIAILLSIYFGYSIAISEGANGIGALFIEVLIFPIYFIIILALSYSYKKDKETRNELLISIPIIIGIVILSNIIGAVFTNISYQKDKKEWRKRELIQQKEDSLKFIDDTKRLTRLLKEYPDSSDLLVERGLLKRRRGKYKESILDYEKAIEIDSNNYRAHREAGYSKNISFDYAGAIPFYEAAYQIDSSDIKLKESIKWLYNKVKEEKLK